MYIVLPNAGALIFLRNPKEQMAWGHDGVWRRVQNGAIRGISHFFFFTFNWTRKGLLGHHGGPGYHEDLERQVYTFYCTGYHVDFSYFLKVYESSSPFLDYGYPSTDSA